MAKVSVIGICGESLFFSVDRLPHPGETLHTNTLHTEYGGKGINQAIAAKRMGCEVSFLCAVGDDASGKGCADFIHKQGINARLAVKSGQKSPIAAILTENSGENEVIVFSGATPDENDILDFEDEIAGSDVLLLQNEISEGLNLLAASLAKKHSVKVILNPAPERPVSKALSLRTYIAVPNEHEEKALNKLDFQNIITTCGAKGCIINSENIIPAAKVNVVDTTGAGDTFCGTLAAQIASGYSITEAVRYAVAASGLSVERKGVIDAIPYKEEVERMIENE